MMINLFEALTNEIERNSKLIHLYEEIGPVGAFGKIMIQADIDNAKKALASGDVVEIAQAYEAMKDNE